MLSWNVFTVTPALMQHVCDALDHAPGAIDFVDVPAGAANIFAVAA